MVKSRRPNQILLFLRSSKLNTFRSVIFERHIGGVARASCGEACGKQNMLQRKECTSIGDGSIVRVFENLRVQDRIKLTWQRWCICDVIEWLIVVMRLERSRTWKKLLTLLRWDRDAIIRNLLLPMVRTDKLVWCLEIVGYIQLDRHIVCAWVEF